MGEHGRTAAWMALLLLGIALSAVQLGGHEAHVHSGHSSHAGHAGHDHGEQHKPQRLFSWEPEEAHTLVLRGSDGRELTFVRGQEGWTGSGPVSASSDQPFDPGQYVALLSQARKDREFAAEDGALHSFGLAPAALRIRIQDVAGAMLADLSVGTRTPDGFGRYVREPSDTNVLIVPAYQFEKAMKVFG